MFTVSPRKPHRTRSETVRFHLESNDMQPTLENPSKIALRGFNREALERAHGFTREALINYHVGAKLKARFLLCTSGLRQVFTEKIGNRFRNGWCEMMKKKKDTASRIKRGRKPVFSTGEDHAILETWGDLISTNRSVRNKQYAQLGAHALCPNGKPDQRFAWLATSRKARQSVLTELGRVARTQGDEAARVVASQIAAMADAGEISTTREAEKLIRAMRLKTSIAETVSENHSEPTP